ncbi:MAG: hypothetical protein SF069_16070 [Phycisphaerae bacterium]|nr:hypothetical protein [Phycisphaerae bacterium]
MSAISKFSKSQLDQVLHELCDHSERVRLRLLTAHDEPKTIYTRFLDITDDYLMLYWPAAGGLDFARTGIPIEAYFGYLGKRYGFLSQTRGRCIHKLNKQGGTAAALLLDIPTELDDRQQRQNFRVPVSAEHPIEVVLERLGGPAEPSESDEAPAVAVPRFRRQANQAAAEADAAPKTLKFRMSNLSIGGLGGVLNLKPAEMPERGSMFKARFGLPGDKDMFEMTLELRHVRAIDEEKTRHYVGWRFFPHDNAVVARETQRRLEKFIAERQRVLLRKFAY